MRLFIGNKKKKEKGIEILITLLLRSLFITVINPRVMRSNGSF